MQDIKDDLGSDGDGDEDYVQPPLGSPARVPRTERPTTEYKSP